MSVHIKESVRSYFGSILDFVYPPLCVSCEDLLENGRDHVCPECWSSIQRVHASLPLFIETRRKLVSSGFVDGLAALFVFEKEGAFQKIVHSLKYSGVQALGLELGRRLGQLIIEEGIPSDMVIPVPLHKRKKRERGYNQSELIARGLSEAAGVALRADLVFRQRFTDSQTTLSLQERKKNMEEAFQCTRAEVRGKSIIVVDDIITTGATIESCAQVLKNAGAVAIIAASAALAE